MRILRHRSDVNDDLRQGVVAIGNFDGVHRGHQVVMTTAKALADAESRPFGVLTFEPHPRSIFQPNLAPFRLTPFRVKSQLIADVGADYLFVQGFDTEFAQTTAEDFIQETLIESLDVRHVVIGHDYAFGKGRTGNPSSLRRMGDSLGFGVTEIAAITGGTGTLLSSTSARDAIREGRCEDAAAIMGRPWFIEGRVEHGDERGRVIGFPTANIHITDSLRPRTGVYAVRVLVEGLSPENGDSFEGVANYGSRPTFDGTGNVLEVHLFDMAENLYDRHLRVTFEKFLRDEHKFDGIEALTTQISEDASTARRHFNDAALDKSK